MSSVVTQGILWGIALVVLVSAASKMSPTGLSRLRRSIADLVSPTIEWIAPLVVLAELVIAALLVIPSTTAYGVVVGSLMLLTFTAVLVSAALRGVEAPCNCFGALSRESPVGHVEVLRNVILLAAILVCLALQGDQIMSPDAAHWIGIAITFTLSAGALAAVVALAVNLRKLGIPVGESGAEHSVGHDSGDEPLYEIGSAVSVPGVADGQVILGVLSTTCGVCVVAAGSFAQTASRTGAEFVALVDDSHPGKPDLVEELDRLGAARLMLSEHPELTPMTQIRPGYAVIDRDGRVTHSGTGHTELAMLLTSHG